MNKKLASVLLLGPILWGVACAATEDSVLDDDPPGGTGGQSTTGGGDDTSGASMGGDDSTGSNFSTGVTSVTSGGTDCINDPDVDDDNDGFTENQGDCNDCDDNVNPDAIEVIGSDDGSGGGGGGMYEPADEDCDMEVDEEEVTVCDQGLAVNDINPMSGAKAIDLCQIAGENGKTWGVVSANYVRANGSIASMAGNNALAVGIAGTFGNNISPQGGNSMLGLSSGYVREDGNANECGSTSCNHFGAGTAPPNFPQDVPGCSGGANINDDVGLELEIKAPTNATGFSFDFAFLSMEFPVYVCSTFNDQFIALVDPPPMGSINGNVSFDSQGNPVSVNIALFDHCDPASLGNFGFGGTPPMPYCPLGPAFLEGTGFAEWNGVDSGATGWLNTVVPVDGGETFTIRYAIWDTGDTALDSTVFIDNFRWTAEEGTTVGTIEIPNPK